MKSTQKQDCSAALKKAIKILGCKKIAALCQIKNPKTVSTWRSNGVPAKHCLIIARATDYLVTPEQLRPDMFSAVNTPRFGGVAA